MEEVNELEFGQPLTDSEIAVIEFGGDFESEDPLICEEEDIMAEEKYNINNRLAVFESDLWNKIHQSELPYKNVNDLSKKIFESNDNPLILSVIEQEFNKLVASGITRPIPKPITRKGIDSKTILQHHEEIHKNSPSWFKKLQYNCVLKAWRFKSKYRKLEQEALNYYLNFTKK